MKTIKEIHDGLKGEFPTRVERETSVPASVVEFIQRTAKCEPQEWIIEALSKYLEEQGK